MTISVVTLTFGRPQHLEEAIESFLRQDYADKRMVILNSCVQQTLTGDFPNVKIINLKERPANLGAARNLAIEACEPGLICVLDDDDLALPHMLSVYAKYLATMPGAQWVFADKQVYLEGGKVMKITNGMANTLAFTKDAWRRVGGYNSLTVGEDRAIVGKITASEPGVKASIENTEIAYLYAWGQGTYHISGLGDDQRNRVPAWERSRLDLESKLRRGIVKSGAVTLKPAWKQDYSAIVRDFLIANQLLSKIDGLGVVMLGKFGDIINCLPILKRLHERGNHPHVIVSKAFASIFEGVSYATPFPVDLPFENLLEAMKIAESRFKSVLRLQVYGRGHHQAHDTPAYNTEQWQLAGMLDEFHNAALLPVFDRRNLPREQLLAGKLFVTKKPKIITSLTCAASSPFARGHSVLGAIMAAFKSTHEVVEIGRLRLHRIYDLLSVIEEAALLVSVDTATLHLAAATNVPVLALVNDTPWAGTAVRFNAVATIPYREAKSKRVIEEMQQFLKRL